jgi:hypothetical protein
MHIQANRRIYINTTPTYGQQWCNTGLCFNLKYFIVLKIFEPLERSSLRNVEKLGKYLILREYFATN